MTFIIDKDEATAARRRVPFRVFLSNGTAPDTGVSNDTVMMSVNGAAQLSAGSASAVSAAAGMYYIEPTQSHVSVLGSIALWYDLGDFAQHVANVQVVNFNPMSSFSNIAAASYSGVTIQGLSNYANISNVTLHAGTHSNVTIQGVTRVNSNVTLNADTHSGATVQGVTRVNSNVTIANATYSAVTVQVAGIVPASFTAGAIDAAALATDAGSEIADRLLARDLAGGSDTSRSVQNALRTLRNRIASDATKLYVYEEDDSTLAWDASLTTAASTANHITAFDP